MQPIRFVLASCALAAIGFACSTATTVQGEWKNPSYAAGPMKSMLVYGLGMSEPGRRMVEDRFVAALGKRGVRARPAYSVYPDRIPDRAELRSYLLQGNYDGILVSALLGVRSETTVSPSSDFYGHWSTGYYVETEDYVDAETTLWEPRTGALVWSAVTETENPSSHADAAQSLVSKIMSRLTDASLIPSGPSVAARPSFAPRTL